MSKKVIFDPEDFDKPQKKSSKKKLAWVVGICSVLALVGIGGYALLAPKALEPADEIASATTSGVDSANQESISYEASSSLEISNEANANSTKMDAAEQKSAESLADTHEDQNSVSAAESSLTINTTTQIDDDMISREAMKVIRGDYGDGKARINKLGSNYHAIQARVNQLKCEGAF